MRPWFISLALPLLGACSFDATGNSAPTAVSGDGTDDSSTGTSTTTPSPTSTTTTADTSTTGVAPTSSETTGPLDTTAPPLTDTTDPTLTTDTDPSTGTTGPVDPTMTSGSEGSSSSNSSSGGDAMCGDGVVEGDEACDDGNKDDDDECLQTCVAASCGDGHTWMGMEACDDGNANEADGCTSMCEKPTCMDQAMNGMETDVDCGGNCPKCEVGQMCDDGNDCASGNCDGVCLPPEDCAEIEADGLPTGAYLIDPDGGGPVDPFMVWCDNDTSGGGWTLVLKADGTKTTFGYAGSQWTTAAPYMPDPDMSRDETKLNSYSTVAVKEILVGMEAPIGMNGGLMLKYIVLNPADGNSLHAMISPGAYINTPNQEATWRMLMPMDGSLQDSCKRQGLNVKGDNGMPEDFARVRLGIIANDQGNCDTVNSWIGVGGDTTGSNCHPEYTSTVGNRAACGADNGDKDTKGFAVVFVR